jgi:predicted alpha/beta hydrolase family esterase
LDGDAVTTWHPSDMPEDFWPKWLGNDVSNVGIWSVGYAVSSTAWKGTAMPLVDRATNILDLLELDDIGTRPIVFICHSLGGLLVKQLLRHACDSGNPEYQKIADQTKAIVFLSTPHSGADLASWLQHIGSLLRATVTIDELQAHDPNLRDLNQWYRNHKEISKIKTLVYCEKQTVGGILVVNETTADPGIAGVAVVPLDENHITICKPGSRESQVYRRVKKIVLETIRPPH